MGLRLRINPPVPRKVKAAPLASLPGERQTLFQQSEARIYNLRRRGLKDGEVFKRLTSQQRIALGEDHPEFGWRVKEWRVAHLVADVMRDKRRYNKLFVKRVRQKHPLDIQSKQE